MYQEITATLQQMKQPSAAQKFMDDQAMQASQWLAGGDYRNTPNNMFLSLEDPAVENERRRTMLDSLGSGVTALAENGANSTALALNKDYLNDKWARDSAANYQDQISQASQRTLGALGASADASLNRQNSLLQGQMGALSKAPKTSSIWGDLIRGGISMASSFI